MKRATFTAADLEKLANAVWSEYHSSLEEKWTFRKEHVLNAMLADLADPAPTRAEAQCCMCGKRELSTEEDSGPECELTDGRWVCSRSCYERAVDGPTLAEALSLPEVAALVEAGNRMANSIKGDYIHPGAATSWDATLRAIEEDK